MFEASTVRTRDEEVFEKRISDALAYQIRQDVRDVLSRASGRRLLERVLVIAGTRDDTPIGNAAATNTAIGRRQVGLALLALIEDVDRNATIVMREEYEQMREVAALRARGDAPQNDIQDEDE